MTCNKSTARKEYFRAYKQANKERIAEQQRAYKQANKERIAEQQRMYYQANKQRIVKRQLAYYQANKERIAEQRRAYYQANKHRLTEQRHAKDNTHITLPTPRRCENGHLCKIWPCITCATSKPRPPHYAPIDT